MGRGPLTHEFAIPNYAAGGHTAPFIIGRRMVVPYQLYMLQQLCDDYLPARETLGHAELVAFLCECGDACTSRASGKAVLLFPLPIPKTWSLRRSHAEFDAATGTAERLPRGEARWTPVLGKTCKCYSIQSVSISCEYRMPNCMITGR